MLSKSVFLALGFVCLSAVGALLSGPVRTTPDAVSVRLPSDTLFAKVEVDSLKVLSYFDDAGLEHPADSTLVPPRPVQGPRNVTFVVRGPLSSEPVAGVAR
jgi:hypothetical protein